VAFALPATAQVNPERNVYYGERHLHTSWSLRKQGATMLSEPELLTLVVGKTVQVRNTVTGKVYEILYGANGQRLVTAIDGTPVDARNAAELLHGGQESYRIADGRLQTDIAGTTFDVTVYRLGDRHYAARSDEFGYANYEVIAAAD
jgi:hypothetical protein